MFGKIKDTKKAMAMMPKIMAKLQEFEDKSIEEIRALLIDAIKQHMVHENNGTLTDEIDEELTLDITALGTMPSLRDGGYPDQKKIKAYIEECEAEAETQIKNN